MKKKGKLSVVFFMLTVALTLISMSASAKTTKAAKYELKNVMEAEPVVGTWSEDAEGAHFLLADGTAVLSRFINVDGVIYYMDKAGVRTSGWVKYRGRLYYMEETGALHSGWLTLKKGTYYFGADGAMVKGFQTIDGESYYFHKKTGVRRTGWITVGKFQRYFNKKTGQMKKSSWVKTGRKYYYVNTKGKKRKSGWLTIDGKKYYLDKNGARVTGKYFIKGKGYFFKKNGVYDPTVKVKGEVDPDKPMVALTFDDGPGRYTDRLLNCLQKNDAKATFFMVGSSVGSYQSAVKRMAQLGCELGCHSWSHPQFTSLSVAGMSSEMSRTSDAIRRACGKGATLCRLPYGDGAWNATVLSAVGFPSIYWSIDTRDWANTGNPQHTINEVLNNVKSGDIVLMHDIHYSSVVAAETIIPALKNRGYQLVTVSQLAKYKGKTTLKKGTTYRGFR